MPDSSARGATISGWRLEMNDSVSNRYSENATANYSSSKWRAPLVLVGQLSCLSPFTNRRTAEPVSHGSAVLRFEPYVPARLVKYVAEYRSFYDAGVSALG